MSEQSISASASKNTNRWSTRQLVIMALMTAISVLLSFIEFPLIPGVTFLKYDASCMVAMVIGFAYGAGPGVTVGVIGALIHGMIMGDWVGALMNIFIVLGMVLPSAIIYNRNRTFKGAIVGLVVAILVTLVVAAITNLAIDPIYFGMPFEAVAEMLVPALLPFNLAKAVVNSLLTVIVYKSVKNLFTDKKDQVKGR